MLKNPYHIHGPRDLMVPGHLNFGTYILDKMWAFKNKVAMIDASTDESITYGEIVQQAMNFSVSLTRMGVGKGDVVGLISENRQEFWGAALGVACAGAALTTISPTYVKDEFKNALTISKPKVLVCSPFAYDAHANAIRSWRSIAHVVVFGPQPRDRALQYRELVAGPHVRFQDFTAADVDGQTDTLLIIYSSGTTGLPKGVMLTHLNVLTAACLPVAIDPSSDNFTISPWYHAMGLIGTLSGLATGRTGYYLPKFDTDLYLRTIEKQKITQLTVVPPILVAVSKWPRKYDLSSVRFIYSGAAPLHKETLEAVYKRFPNLQAVYQGYGASETTLGVIKFRLEDIEGATKKAGSVGIVVPGTIVKVADIETRQALGPNQRGEICVKGPMLMKGYVGRGRGNDFDEEGFYKTGDVGYYDEDGYFFIVDRLKELIKYKGSQVPPAELEALLLTHPAVKDVAVIGIPYKSEEVPLAFVVVQENKTVTEQELKQFVAERLSNPKHLRGGVRFVDVIPKSASGKILRKELRQIYRGLSKL